jgi:hypothetical protein
MVYLWRILDMARVSDGGICHVRDTSFDEAGIIDS